MKPFIVEFSGTLEAGKTTSIRTIANMLRNDGYKVLELQESAELLPKEFKKGTFESNMWMHFITQAGLLKALYSDTDIVLVDRGYFDSKFYGYKFYKEGMCNKEEYDEDVGDENIDFRRVRNIKVYLDRNVLKLPNDSDFNPGDIVVYNNHIAIVSDKVNSKNENYILHQHMYQPYEYDGLFKNEILGHYRWRLNDGEK